MNLWESRALHLQHVNRGKGVGVRRRGEKKGLWKRREGEKRERRRKKRREK